MKYNGNKTNMVYSKLYCCKSPMCNFGIVCILKLLWAEFRLQFSAHDSWDEWKGSGGDAYINEILRQESDMSMMKVWDARPWLVLALCRKEKSSLEKRRKEPMPLDSLLLGRRSPH